MEDEMKEIYKGPEGYVTWLEDRVGELECAIINIVVSHDTTDYGGDTQEVVDEIHEAEIKGDHRARRERDPVIGEAAE